VLPSSQKKISNLRLSISSNPTTSLPTLTLFYNTSWFLLFYTYTFASEILKILSNCSNKPSDSDPFPIWLIKECASVFVLTITNISVISKIIERVVKSRLVDHLTSNKLLNPHQSAYVKHYSTKTALLYIHDHLINGIGSQKVSCLCLLDLSAAFDTIDHNILITRLSSWFGIHGSVHSWFKSYLSSSSFRVKCDDNLSSFHTSSCGVPQGSVLGPLLFVVYTTSQYSYLFPFPWQPPLCRWHSALLRFPPIQLWLKHFSPSKRSSTDLFLGDCS